MVGPGLLYSDIYHLIGCGCWVTVDTAHIEEGGTELCNDLHWIWHVTQTLCDRDVLVTKHWLAADRSLKTDSGQREVVFNSLRGEGSVNVASRFNQQVQRNHQQQEVERATTRSELKQVTDNKKNAECNETSSTPVSIDNTRCFIIDCVTRSLQAVPTALAAYRCWWRYRMYHFTKHLQHGSCHRNKWTINYSKLLPQPLLQLNQINLTQIYFCSYIIAKAPTDFHS